MRRAHQSCNLRKARPCPQNDIGQEPFLQGIHQWFLCTGKNKVRAWEMYHGEPGLFIFWMSPCCPDYIGLNSVDGLTAIDDGFLCPRSVLRRGIEYPEPHLVFSWRELVLPA